MWCCAPTSMASDLGVLQPASLAASSPLKPHPPSLELLMGWPVAGSVLRGFLSQVGGCRWLPSLSGSAVYAGHFCWKNLSQDGLTGFCAVYPGMSLSGQHKATPHHTPPSAQGPPSPHLRGAELPWVQVSTCPQRGLSYNLFRPFHYFYSI